MLSGRGFYTSRDFWSVFIRVVEERVFKGVFGCWVGNII